LDEMSDSRHFYRDLQVFASFADAVVVERHTAVPRDWWIVIADVTGSTRAIEAGQYKNVNTVGVACIAAALNVDRSIELPFIFGGDGATLAVPDCLVERIKTAMRGAQALARSGFGLDLRVGLVRVGDLLDQDFWVNVAKLRLSGQMTQASFSGRGWNEAEQRVKAGADPGVVCVSEDDGPAEASFEGFECRWHTVPQFNGHKLSLLVAAVAHDPRDNLATYQAVADRIRAIYGDEANYHPLRPGELNLSLSIPALSHEWKVRTRQAGFFASLRYLAGMLFQNLAGRYLFARELDTRFPEIRRRAADGDRRQRSPGGSIGRLSGGAIPRRPARLRHLQVPRGPDHLPGGVIQRQAPAFCRWQRWRLRTGGQAIEAAVGAPEDCTAGHHSLIGG